MSNNVTVSVDSYHLGTGLNSAKHELKPLHEGDKITILEDEIFNIPANTPSTPDGVVSWVVPPNGAVMVHTSHGPVPFSHNLGGRQAFSFLQVEAEGVEGKGIIEIYD